MKVSDAQLGTDHSRTEHRVVEAGPEMDMDVDGVVQSRRSGAASIALTAASLALEIADRNIEPPNAGKTKKGSADDYIFDIFDIFAESDDEADEAATAAVGCRKLSRGDIVINDIVDDDEPAREAHHRSVKRRTQPHWSARRMRGAQRPTPPNDTKLITNSARRSQSLASGRWKVILILDERQTDERFMYKVIARKGRETRTD